MTPVAAAKKRFNFDPNTSLATIAEGRQLPSFALARDPRISLVLGALKGADVRDPIQLRRIAASVNLSISRLRHLFAQEIGVPLARYAKDTRLIRARHLLQNSLLTVKEVASVVGINDLSHFVRDYEARYQETPAQSRGRFLGPNLRL